MPYTAEYTEAEDGTRKKMSLIVFRVFACVISQQTAADYSCDVMISH